MDNITHIKIDKSVKELIDKEEGLKTNGILKVKSFSDKLALLIDFYQKNNKS